MIFENRLSTTPIAGVFLDNYGTGSIILSRIYSGNKKEAFTRAGIAHNNPVQGLQVQMWRAWVEGEDDIYIEAENAAPILAYSGENITELDLAFDQNMRWCCAFTENGIAKLNWYDNTLNQRVLITYPASVFNLKVFMDDKRTLETDVNDILMAYLVKTENNTYLSYRQQRDRFITEYQLVNITEAFPELRYRDVRLVSVEMNENYRIQFNIACEDDDG